MARWLATLLAGGGGLFAGPAASQAPAPAASASCPALRRSTIIWQPWASHAQLGPAYWNQMGELIRKEGYQRVVIQWTAYGSAEFWPAHAPRWLATAMTQWHAPKLRLIVGLYMGDEYYSKLQLGDEDVRAHMVEAATRSVAIARRLKEHPPPLPIDGWYLPQEVDDLNWQSLARERMLRSYLTKMRDALNRLAPAERPIPIFASTFFSGATSPQRFARKLARLHLDTGVIWVVQGGMGTRRMTEAATAPYLKAISATLPPSGWVGLLEVFDEQSKDGEITFVPSADETIEQRRHVWCSSTGRQPIMAFSLNQRMDKLRGGR